jgi:hypothetical protein
MRTKELKVGMEVAVNHGAEGILRRAFILEVNTVWTPACIVFQQLPDSVPFRNSVAIAWKQANARTWQPGVVKAAQIVSTWADYEAGQAKKRAKQAADQEKERLQLVDYNRKRTECREILGIGTYSAYVGIDERLSFSQVTVDLRQLHNLALELKQLRESLQKLQREHFCGKGDKPCDEIILKS